MVEQAEYYKLVDNKKVYYAGGKLIGDELKMKAYITKTKGISFSKAAKLLLKIKQFKEMNNAQNSTQSTTVKPETSISSN